MEAVELAIPAAVVVPNLMVSDGVAGARASGVGDVGSCDTGRGLVFTGPRIEKYSASVSQREHSANALDSSSWIKKAETGPCRNTIQLSISDSLVLGAGSEGKKLQKKERRVRRTSPGCFKIPQTPQQEASISTSEDVDMKDVPDELGSHMIKSPNAVIAEKYQQQKQKNYLNSKRGDKRNARVPLIGKHDALAGFRPSPGGNKVFGAYGLKADVHDITKLIDDISLIELLDGSYKCPIVSKEKGKGPAITSENILHLVRKAFSILQPRGFSRVDRHYDEIDAAFTKELSSLPTSNPWMASNLDVDEESSAASDFSHTKVQQSDANNETPPYTSDLPLYHPKDVIEKLTFPPMDLESLLQDAAKPATFSRCNEARPGKPVSRRTALSTFSWSHNHSGHSKSNSDSVKVSSRSSCQGRWLRIGKTVGFLGGVTDSFANLESLTYDYSLVPAGSVKYILPKAPNTISKLSNILSCEQVSSSLICPTSSQSPPALHAPGEMTAAQALYDIANNTSNETAHGIIKWPNQPSQKAMKARKSKSIQSPEKFSSPKSEVMLDSSIKSMDHATPLKKPKLLPSEKKDYSAHISTPKPQHLSAPRSSRSSPVRKSREPRSDTNRHHTNDRILKPSFITPRRVLEKTKHSQQQKLRKVLQMDWNRRQGQL